MHTLGPLLKKKRIHAKITQKELAAKLSVKPQFLWRVETGRVALPTKYLYDTCKILNLDRHSILVHLLEEYRIEMSKVLHIKSYNILKGVE